MTNQFWVIANALQGGAYLALASIFGIDALRRRDKALRHFALSCFLMAGFYVAETLMVAAPALRSSIVSWKSGLATMVFVALMAAFRNLFPGHFPRRAMPLILLCALPNIAVSIYRPASQPLVQVVQTGTILLYACGAFVTAWTVFRAKAEGIAMGARLHAGIMTAVAALLLSVIARFIDLDLDLTGVAVMVVVVTAGLSGLWEVTYDLQRQLAVGKVELNAWRNLFPGHTWRSWENSNYMNELFGDGWEGRIQERMISGDGSTYLMHMTELDHDRKLGWAEALSSKSSSPASPFLQGWQVGLGMDEGDAFEHARRLLEGWGATVIPWATVPPREGPYPSVLIWAREPSILVVWREYDLVRRRCRWIQVGGARIDGPHAYIERPISEQALLEVLRKLLSLQ